MRRRLLAVVSASVLGLTDCNDSGFPPGVSGRFRFREGVTSDAVRLEITTAPALAYAEALLESQQVRWALGTPRRGDGAFNAPWHWHLDPASVAFAEVTIEACQTKAADVEANIDYWVTFGFVCVQGVVEARER